MTGMAKCLLLVVATLLTACESLSGPMGDLPLATWADRNGDAWTLVHAVEPHDRGPTRQYYRLFHVPAGSIQVAGNAPPNTPPSAAPESPVWQADALPPLDGPLSQTAVLAPGKIPTAWIAGHYPGGQVFLTRVVSGGETTRWALPDRWPEAYALDVTANATRTWVRPEQWLVTRPDDAAPLVEVGNDAQVIAENALWMGCAARDCAYATYSSRRITLHDQAGRVVGTAKAEPPMFAAACRAGPIEYIITDREYFPVAVTGIGDAVTHTTDVSALLSQPGTLECRRAPWLWRKDLSATTLGAELSSFDVTATAVRDLPAGLGKDAQIRLSRTDAGWYVAQASPGADQAMSCDPEGSWTFYGYCSASYRDYTLKLFLIRGN